MRNRQPTNANGGSDSTADLITTNDPPKSAAAATRAE